MKKSFLYIFLLVLLIPSFASAHSGGTDSNGGHHCWTNCSSYGYKYGEYHYHNSGYDYDYSYNDYDYEYYEKQLRKENYNNAVSEGEKLLKLLNVFNTAINSGDINKIDGMYDQFSDQISQVEYLIGSVYGSENRAKLLQKYITPSKIAKERTIYEISQLRLLSDINYYINEGSDVDYEFGKLERLVKRAVQIKKAGGYKALPNKINQYLRYQDALIQGYYLNKKAYYLSQLTEDGYISGINDEYDYFTHLIRATELKIGKVPGNDNRELLGNRFIKPTKILKERVIYEISQYRLLEKTEELYYLGDYLIAKNYLNKLERLKSRAIEIKIAGGYKSLPSSVKDELERMEDWLRYWLNNN